MFGASPSFAEDVPPAIAAPGFSYWRAMELTLRGEWYVVSLAIKDGDERVLRDLAISWSADLISVAMSNPEAVVSILALQPNGKKWESKAVMRLWLGTDPKNCKRRVPVLELAGGDFICDRFDYSGPPAELIDLDVIWADTA